MTSHPSTAGRLATIALAAFALLALTLGAYVGGYLWLGTMEYATSFDAEWIRGDDGEYVLDDATTLAIERNYPHLWARNIFQPAAKVESWLRGCEVNAVYGPLNDEPYLPRFSADEIPPDSLNSYGPNRFVAVCGSSGTSGTVPAF